MPKLSMWKPNKGLNYKFIDFHVKQQFEISSTAVMVHKYLGPVEQGDDGNELREKGDLTQPNYAGEKQETTETDIQDLLFLENRDRKYSTDVYELRGNYQVQDNDFNLSQFGFMFNTDNIMISFHYNTMLELLGRKLMSGDVLELPHLRDTDPLDPNAKPIKKFYVVDDAKRSAEGFDPHWHHHIWQVRCAPMQNQQEYLDILRREDTDFYGDGVGSTLEEIISTLPSDIMISNAIDAEADRQVSHRNFETQHLYIMPVKDQFGNVVERDHAKYPICFNYGDGVPPNGAIPVGSGTDWPLDAKEGDYYLRTDMSPHALYRKQGSIWKREEIDLRSRWSSANDLLKRFINNSNKFRNKDPEDSREFSERQYLSKVLKPKIDM